MTLNRQLLLTVTIKTYDDNGSQRLSFQMSRNIEDTSEDSMLYSGSSTTITTEDKTLHLGDTVSFTTIVVRCAIKTSSECKGH